jgi:Protein of unknown function (DUF997)
MLKESPTLVEHPLLKQSRREAVWSLVLWLFAALWTLGYCGYYGYPPQPEPTFIYGVPTWVFWGIFVPWCICTLLSCLFALCFMQSDAFTEAPTNTPQENAVQTYDNELPL